MKRSIKKIIEEELELTRNIIWSRIGRIFECENRSSSRSRMKLQFKNRKISQTVLTGEEIKGEGNATIEVNLVDDSTGNVIDVGPEASASVEIVLLEDGGPADDDDCSVEDFDANIVREIQGKKPLLVGNLRVKLQGGVGVMENIKLRHHASKIRPAVFRLGARVVDAFGGVRIKEARTEIFTVRDFRNKYYKKHETPSHSDEVSRLVNIRKGGKIDKRLKDAKIFTVEDFLIRLLIDPEGLKSQIAKMGAKKWDATVNNARACPADKRMYFYLNSEQKIGIVFNHFGQVLGLYSESQHDSSSVLSEHQMAYAQEFLASAYEHWERVVPFDDINSLQQYFTGLSTYREPTDSAVYERTEGIGESNDRISFETMFPGFDEFLQSSEDINRQTNENDVAIGRRPKRWKTLYCVSRLFSVKKMVSLEGIKNVKRRKFG